MDIPARLSKLWPLYCQPCDIAHYVTTHETRVAWAKEHMDCIESAVDSNRAKPKQLKMVLV